MKQYLLPLYFQYRFTKYFFQFIKPIGFKNLIWCYFNGFFPKNFVLFNLSKNDPKYYVSDFEENFKISRINKNPQVLNNKLVFPEIIGSFFKAPQIHALIYQGKLLPYKPESEFTETFALQYLKSGNAIIMKPIDGDGGIGIVKVYFDSIQAKYNWNGNLIQEEELLKRFSTLNNYLVSDFVKQGEYTATLYSNAVNTIRIMSMIDPETGRPFVAFAAHRIGNDQSAPVDNCAMGGYTAPIDVKTGTMGAASASKFSGMTKPHYPIHPHSGNPIEGVVIPQWEKLKHEICELHGRLNYINYIGWDIVYAADGHFYLLEGNDQVDLKLHQVHSPLLLDSAVKKFYTYHIGISR